MGLAAAGRERWTASGGEATQHAYGDAGFLLNGCSAGGEWANSSALKASVLHRMRSRHLHFRCVAKVEDLAVGLGDRQPEHVCFDGAETLVAGQWLTSLAFLHPELPETGDLVLQHIHYQGYVVVEGDSHRKPFVSNVDNAYNSAPDCSWTQFMYAQYLVYALGLHGIAATIVASVPFYILLLFESPLIGGALILLVAGVGYLCIRRLCTRLTATASKTML